jgi:hypothetical protein
MKHINWGMTEAFCEDKTIQSVISKHNVCLEGNLTYFTQANMKAGKVASCLIS